MKNLFTEAVAVVGIACRFPDANNPDEFWDNILSSRRSFRRIPQERLNSHYFSNDNNPDTIYTSQVAVLKNYEFDRKKFKISGSSFRSADLSHWLALDVATDAIKDADINSVTDLPLLETGVFVGNTLTGEFSRANLMRVRWPYVANVMYQQLLNKKWREEDIKEFLSEFEQKYKSPFTPMSEDSLAGGLSNTIAGRICNYFDFKGGGYTVDGACSSSLLAISNACTAISSGELKAALVGGVDLSLDPFELVGFSRAGALAKNQMLVYDRNSEGFWPGEGCGFVLLMSQEEALSRNLNIYALIKGWGISSDGHGGLTRPTSEGQLLAIDRAYKKAGYEIDSVCYLEGHGTGTKVGDEAELNTILKALNNLPQREQPLLIGSVKSNIGHTKAAAGIAGFLKAILVTKHKIIPPITGCMNPHFILVNNPTKFALPECAVIHDEDIMRVGISAMGFGGINVHVTIENSNASVKKAFTAREKLLIHSVQDAETFVFSAKNAEELEQKVKQIYAFCTCISSAEMADLSYTLYNSDEQQQYRVAVVASNPQQLSSKLEVVLSILSNNQYEYLDLKSSIFLSSSRRKMKIGYMFPGQGGRIFTSGGIYSKRFSVVKEIFQKININKNDSASNVPTEVAQLAIMQASVAGIELLRNLGIEADLSIGHSLGELSALYYNESFDSETLTQIVKARGQLMGNCPGEGKMLSLKVAASQLSDYLSSNDVVIAGINSANQTIVSGKREAVIQLQKILDQDNIPFVELRTSHAFHSPLMEPAKLPYLEFLASKKIVTPRGKIISTITGNKITAELDIKQLLTNQLNSPVLFKNAIELANEEVDAWVELGFGKVLSDLTYQQTSKPSFPLEIGSDTLYGLLNLISFIYINEHRDILKNYFLDRVYKSFDLRWSTKFLSNPCEVEKTATENILLNSKKLNEPDIIKKEFNTYSEITENKDILSLLVEVISKYTELPIEKIHPENRMLDDLHLNSITVAQLIGQAAKLIGVGTTQAPTEYANATVMEICSMLEVSKSASEQDIQPKKHPIPGLDTWVKPFHIIYKHENLKFDYTTLNSKVTTNEEDYDSSTWATFGSEQHINSKEKIVPNLETCSNKGVLVNLLYETDAGAIKALVDSVKSISNETQHYILLQRRNYAAGFVKSIFYEFPKVNFLIVTCKSIPKDYTWLAKEVIEGREFTEVLYESDFKRYIPLLSPLATIDKNNHIAINNADVVLVTGGGKGITCECALALACKTGATLVILGKSTPDTDQKLSENLLRFKKHKIKYYYFSVDITNKETVKRNLKFIQQEIGSISLIIHGAGVNVPVPAIKVSVETTKATLGPKVDGLRNILDSIQVSQVKMLVSFGSIISEVGMRGNADYALANEWLRNLVEDWRNINTDCRCINIAWSVWSGTGMGENLGLLEHLISQGIEPISVDSGKKIFLDILESTIPFTNVIVTGRFKGVKTLEHSKKQPPLLRYLEKVHTYLPSIEVISDFKLSAHNDPYLLDHILNKNFIFPGVMGLEAMAQATDALIGNFKSIVFTNISFKQPIVLTEEGELDIRILALMNDNKIELAVRSEETLFQEDHFKCECYFDESKGPIFVDNYESSHSKVKIDPKTDLYQNLLFQSGSFQRINSYCRITPYSCIAKSSALNSKWFGTYLPQQLILGDPGIRDSALHAVQVCVPDRIMVPVSAEKVEVVDIQPTTEVTIYATEISHDKDLYSYNITLINQDKSIREVWTKVTFKALGGIKSINALPLVLIEVLLQRKVDELTSGIVVELGNQFKSNSFNLLKRPDGRPYLNGSQLVSKSNCGNLQLIVSAQIDVGCDIELVNELSVDEWKELIGEERHILADFISKKIEEPYDVSATRVWGAVECLKKAGENLFSPLSFDSYDNIMLLKSATKSIISYAVMVKETKARTVFSILVNTAYEGV